MPKISKTTVGLSFALILLKLITIQSEFVENQKVVTIVTACLSTDATFSEINQFYDPKIRNASSETPVPMKVKCIANCWGRKYGMLDGDGHLLIEKLDKDLQDMKADFEDCHNQYLQEADKCDYAYNVVICLANRYYETHE